MWLARKKVNLIQNSCILTIMFLKVLSREFNIKSILLKVSKGHYAGNKKMDLDPPLGVLVGDGKLDPPSSNFSVA